MKRNEHPQLNSFTSFIRGQVSSFLFFALLRRKNEPRGLKKINLQLFADTSDKTEKATPKKRAELRKKGQVMQSREVTSNLILLITFIAIRVFGSFLYQEISSVFRVFLTGTSQYNLQEPAEAMRIFSFVVFKILKMTAPFFIIVVLMGFGKLCSDRFFIHY